MSSANNQPMCQLTEPKCEILDVKFAWESLTVKISRTSACYQIRAENSPKCLDIGLEAGMYAAQIGYAGALIMALAMSLDAADAPIKYVAPLFYASIGMMSLSTGALTAALYCDVWIDTLHSLNGATTYSADL